jgi:hypothetical protein
MRNIALRHHLRLCILALAAHKPNKQKTSTTVIGEYFLLLLSVYEKATCLLLSLGKFTHKKQQKIDTLALNTF